MSTTASPAADARARDGVELGVRREYADQCVLAALAVVAVALAADVWGLGVAVAFLVTDGAVFDPVEDVIAWRQLLDASAVLAGVAAGIGVWYFLLGADQRRREAGAPIPFERWWVVGAWLVPYVHLLRPRQILQALGASAAVVRPWWRPWLGAQAVVLLAALWFPRSPTIWPPIAVGQPALEVVAGVLLLVAGLRFRAVLRAVLDANEPPAEPCPS